MVRSAWTDDEAPMTLGTALGQIAADLWLSGHLALKEGQGLAIFSPHADAKNNNAEKHDRESAGHGG